MKAKKETSNLQASFLQLKEILLGPNDKATIDRRVDRSKLDEQPTISIVNGIHIVNTDFWISSRSFSQFI